MDHIKRLNENAVAFQKRRSTQSNKITTTNTMQIKAQNDKKMKNHNCAHYGKHYIGQIGCRLHVYLHEQQSEVIHHNDVFLELKCVSSA